MRETLVSQAESKFVFVRDVSEYVLIPVGAECWRLAMHEALQSFWRADHSAGGPSLLD